QHHIRGFYALPARDRGAVECDPGFQLFFIYGMGRNREVMFFAPRISKAEVNKGDLAFCNEFDDVFGCGHIGLLSQCKQKVKDMSYYAKAMPGFIVMIDVIFSCLGLLRTKKGETHLYGANYSAPKPNTRI